MTRLERLARAYDQLAERFGAWAATEDAIRAAIVIGSRAREDHAADEWADLDILVLASDSSRFVDDSSWVDAIGDVWISFTEPTSAGHGFERRVLFAGGIDVDFAFLSVGEMEALLQADSAVVSVAFGRGAKVLVDKDGLAARVLDQPLPPAVSSAPDAGIFREVASDFWYHAVWTAKHLRRGELWWAKGSCDFHMKELLRRVLEWHAAAEGRDPWFRGRFLEEWADPVTVGGLRTAFAHYDEDEIWDALVTTMDLFGEISRRTATALALPYPEAAEQRSRALVAELRATRPAPPADEG